MRVAGMGSRLVTTSNDSEMLSDTAKGIVTQFRATAKWRP
jgi:hypothetical protein